MKLLEKILPSKKLILSDGREISEPRSVMPLVIIFLVVATTISVEMTGFDLSVLIKRSSFFFKKIAEMFPPDVGYLPRIWEPLLDTIKMSLLGSFIGSVIAIPFAVIAASNIIKNKVILFVTRIFLSLVRTVPTLIVALIATYIFGLGTFAGTTAIAVFTYAYVGKLLYEQIETVDMGAFEAMEALGATKTRAFLSAIVPQVLPGYIANCLFCFEGNVRYASILGYVGAGGLGLILNEKVSWREYQSVGMILVALFFTVLVIELISYQLRKRLA